MTASIATLLRVGTAAAIRNRSGCQLSPAFTHLAASRVFLGIQTCSKRTALDGRGGGGKGDAKISKGKRKGDLPTKTCIVCGRPFTWRAKWAKVWDDVKYCSDRCRGQRSKGGGQREGEGESGAGEKGGGKQSKSLTTPPLITKTALNPTAVGTLTPRRGFLSCLSGAGGGLAAAAILAGRKASNPTEGTNKGKNMAWIAQDETRFRPRAAHASGEQARRPGKGEIDGLLEGKSEEALWPEPLPPYVKSDFARLDETDDALFYDTPKLVEHIDKAAVRSLSAYYRETFQEVGDRLYGESGRLLDILDVGASWVSHFPPSYTRAQEADGQDPLGKRCRVAGLGMSAEELALNPQLTEFTVQDLNKNPRLPYADGSFDLVVSALTIDYLVRPITLCREMGRVLRPGGRVCVLFSNRLFFTKAVANWAGKDDVDHVLDVATYLHYANGESGSGVGEKMLSKPHAKDISPSPTKGDPLYVVWADRL